MSCKVCDELVKVIGSLRDELDNAQSCLAEYKIDVANLQRDLKEQEKGYAEASATFRSTFHGLQEENKKLKRDAPTSR